MVEAATAFQPAPGERLAWAPQPGPQISLLTCPVADALYGGARGGGKTDGLLGEWLSHQRAYPGKARGLFIRRTYDELDEVVTRAAEMFPPSGGVWRPGKNTWHWPSGNFFRLRYLKKDADAGNYQGHSYTRVFIDEAGNFASPEPIDKLRATLRSKHGVPCALRQSANPGGPGHEWLVNRYIKNRQPGIPFTDLTTGTRRVFIPSRLSDNPALALNDPTYVDRLRASGPAWLVKAWLDGDWSVTPDGGLIKGQWFQRYTTNPDFFLIVQSWDTGGKEAEHNDPSVCTTWGITRHPRFYLLDVYRERMEYPKLRSAVRNQAAKWSPGVILIEDKSSGTALIQELRAAGLGNTQPIPIFPVEPIGNKWERAVAASFYMEAGQVYLPVESEWVLDYEIELTTFPLAAHDDRVDSTSQFLIWAKDNAARVAWGSTSELPAQPTPDQFNRGFGTLRADSDLSGY